MIASIPCIPLSLLFLILLVVQVQGRRPSTRQVNAPVLLFNPMGDQKTCETTLIRWAFSSRDTSTTNMTLLISKVSPPTSTNTVPISRTLNITVDPRSGEFKWKVDVPPGRYRFNASFPILDATFQSETFNVKMVLSSKASLSSSTLSPSAATPSLGASDPDATSLPTISCPKGRSAKTSNVYVLVGVAIGANALLVETVFTCFLLRRGKIAPWRLRP